MFTAEISRIRFFIHLLLLVCLSIWPCDLQAMSPIQRSVLPNGLVVLQSEDHSLPFVTMELLIDSGSLRDPAGEEGLSNITASTLLLGSASKTALQISEELDFMGASLNASSGREYTIVSLRVLKKDLLKGFALLMDALTQPTFPEEELKREIEKASAAIQAQEDNPGALAEKEFRKTLFPDSAYGYPVEGTKASLATLTRYKIIKFFKSYYIAADAILTIVGDITPEEVKADLMPGLAKLPAGVTPEKAPAVKAAEWPQTVNVSRSITQANIVLGHDGIRRDNPDFYAISVMNYILGRGGFASRLNNEVRAKRGLAYAITSFFETGKYSGSFQVVLQTKNESAKAAIDLVIEELGRIRGGPVSEAELEGAKKYLIGSFPMRLDTQAKLGSFITQVEYYGLGLDYDRRYKSLIGSVTREDIIRVARTYLHPNSLIVVIVGKE